MRQQLLVGSWLRSPLADEQPLAATSADLVARLVAQTKIGPNTTPVQGRWYTNYPYNMTVDAGGAYSVPRYTMPVGHPLQKVWVARTGWGAMQALLDQGVPIPDPAKIPGGTIAPSGTDGSVVIEQGTRLWDFWQLRPRDTNTPRGYDWQCSAAGYHPAAPGWAGWYPGTKGDINPALGRPDGYGWGTAACGMTMIGARLMAEDWQRGTINHKIGFALPLCGPGKLNPATRYDANNGTMTTGPAADALRIPQGACFRLPAGFDTAAWAKAHHTQAPETVVELVCRAIRDYGLVLGDTSGVVQFWAEDVKTFGTPYNPHQTAPAWGNFGHDLPWHLMQQIAPPDAAGI